MIQLITITAVRIDVAFHVIYRHTSLVIDFVRLDEKVMCHNRAIGERQE
jgi:hypothetical protein